MKKDKIMFEPFMKAHAELAAETYCENELGLDKFDPEFEHMFKKHFKKFMEEAYFESMTPGRASNPTTAKISKDVTGIYFLTDPNKFAKEMLPNSTAQEQQFLSSQVRGSIMSLVNALLKTKFSKVFGDTDEPFVFKNMGSEKANEENMQQVVVNRYFRIALFSMMIGHLDKFFLDSSVSPKFVSNTMFQALKEMNLLDKDGEVKTTEMRKKGNRQKFSNLFYNLIFTGRVKIEGES